MSAEARENWYEDGRLDRSECAGSEIYSGQFVPGFSNPNDKGRIARMFQRGHLVRRLDPAWGNDDMALSAEADTFHWTNCSPQVGFFNQGTADPSIPGTGGGALWRAVENYVLRNAVADQQRVTCFTGPIFDDANDRQFRSILVPRRFFKIAVWSEGQALRSLAMIADQRPVIEVWPEALGTMAAGESMGEEAFQEPGELDRVEDFLSTVEEIETLTEIAFGDRVRDADIRHGERAARVSRPEEIQLRPNRRKAIRR